MRSFLASLALVASVFTPGSAQATRYAAYVHPAGVSGEVTIVGSDVFEPIINLWKAGLQRHNITVKFAAEGSTAGVLALMENQATVASMSRVMTKAELSEFVGVRPLQLVIGVDALVIFVSTSNPIRAFSLEQLDAIYSTTRKQGGKGSLTTWGALDVKNPIWDTRKIALYGRDEFSGPRATFRDKVLLKGEFRPGISLKEDAAGIVEAVSLDSAGLGYSSISDLNSLVKAVPILSPSGVPVLPNADSITRGDYPLSNFLYLYVKQPVSAPLQAFLNYVLSEEGQRAVAASHISVPPDVAKDMLKKIR